MYYFYVLYSLRDSKLYKGSTENLVRRLKEHNAGRTPSTRHRRPLILLYFEEFKDKRSVLRRERECKSLDGGATLKTLLVEKGLLEATGRLALRNSGG